MGLNEDEPQQMSLDKKNNRRSGDTGVMTNADAGRASNRCERPTPAGLAWQARREGHPQIKRGGPHR